MGIASTVVARFLNIGVRCVSCAPSVAKLAYINISFAIFGTFCFSIVIVVQDDGVDESRVL